MAIDFRNVNTLWASVLVETMHRCGLTMAVICPGSRSTPLTMAFARHRQIASIPILDERSASFFALGRAKKTGLPTVLVCTSGTAGANFYPAIIEARESAVPLIVLSADRPPELRHCHAGQTIDQVKLYGSFTNWYCEIALPQADLAMLRYLRQNIVRAWQRALSAIPGVVHLNLPLREPLAPIDRASLEVDRLPEDFFDAVTVINSASMTRVTLPVERWQDKSGIIVAGLAQPQNPQAYCQAIAKLSQQLSFPVFAEALSPIRNYADLNPYLISTYDSILRQPDLEQLAPEIIIQVGNLPTSKQLRNWLGNIKTERWVIDPGIENLDPLHGKTIHLEGAIEQLTEQLEPNAIAIQSNYCQRWCKLDRAMRSYLDSALAACDRFYEGKAAWLLSRHLPLGTPIFLANSMSVRYAEYFWQPNNRQIVPYFSRGANGIDGTLSTALGMAYNDRGVLLTGDLALLHDTNGWLIGERFQGHLTVVVINNNGGGIFENLPIVNFPEFEQYFATPQKVDLRQLCRAYGVRHQQIKSWQHLIDSISHLPAEGIGVLEVVCDRHADAAWLNDCLKKFGKSNLNL